MTQSRTPATRLPDFRQRGLDAGLFDNERENINVVYVEGVRKGGRWEIPQCTKLYQNGAVSTLISIHLRISALVYEQFGSEIAVPFVEFDQ